MSIAPRIPSLLLNEDINLPTPSIIYDVAAIKHVIQSLLNDIRVIPEATLLYSVKANRNPTILRLLADMGLGVDVASIEELQAVKKAGFEIIHATSPSFSADEIKMLREAGIFPDFNSLSQLELARIELGSLEEVGLRVKFPLLLSEEEGETTFGEGSRFGINLFEPSIKSYLIKHQIEVKQIHIHLGEMRNVRVMEQVMKSIAKLVKIYPSIESINLGGGLTYLYSDQEEAKNVWKMVATYVEDIQCTLGRSIKLMVEPGMLLMAMCGYLLSSVRSSDWGNDSRNVTLDASAWNLMYWSYPVLVKAYTQNVEEEIHTLYGNTCYEKDIFIQSSINPRLETGDRVLLAPAGAYVTSMARNMHGFPVPMEFILVDDEIYKTGDEYANHSKIQTLPYP
ncbi:conserved hypothetical protein [Bacillus sp. 349Y]|nr:conserved hypothetical protein [Bacillus sp. 349Y]